MYIESWALMRCIYSLSKPILDVESPHVYHVTYAILHVMKLPINYNYFYIVQLVSCLVMQIQCRSMSCDCSLTPRRVRWHFWHRRATVSEKTRHLRSPCCASRLSPPPPPQSEMQQRILIPFESRNRRLLNTKNRVSGKPTHRVRLRNPMGWRDIKCLQTPPNPRPEVGRTLKTT